MRRIAVTLGDPAGIGPEIALKAVARLKPRLDQSEFGLLLVGCGQTYRRRSQELRLTDLSMPVDMEVDAGAWPSVGFIEAGPAGAPIRAGEISAEAGRLAYNAIDIAVRLALKGRASAICTGPISKDALHRAGHHFAGHTELLAHLTGAKDSVMMLAHGAMRVSHITTHVALNDVASRLKPERIRRVVELTDQALRRLGITQPRIAVAALNPHAGEGGLFGREDIDITMPCLAELRREGFLVEGPVPGDTIFVKLRAGQYDAVIAMYHDQGHIPVKLLGFSVDKETGVWNALSGVNITLGLPIIRTSVDHGTAFDIAGRGIANETSLIEAIEYGLLLSKAA
jgi:4-phospho-D-threonate 3-dehydrogenase / 4-phospho-D-erythronate 3-dehydrogenase